MRGVIKGFTALVLSVMSVFAFAGSDRLNGHWLGSWATGVQQPGPFDAPFAVHNDQTLRQIMRISHGGHAVRVRFSNTFGTAELTIRAASVAKSAGGAAVKPGSIRQLTFGGESSVQIAAGAQVWSDPVRLRVKSLSDLAVSMYFGDGDVNPASSVTGHVWAQQTNYVGSGDQTGESDPLTDSTNTFYHYVSGIDVLAKRPAPVIALLGDSIMDGDQSGLDANARYANFLAARIFDRSNPHRALRRAGVLNLGISGNQLITTLIGPNAQARFDRDVLAQTGVTHVLVLIGINDIGLPAFANSIGIPIPVRSADELIAAHKQVIARARAGGLKVIGATLTPSGGFVLPDYNTPTGEAKRQAVNAWIRESGAYDAVIDFDEILRDEDDESLMCPDLTADGLHPNAAGYEAMAKGTSLARLRY